MYCCTCGTDATSGQWVSVSIPGPKGDTGGGGGGGDFSGDYNDLTNKPTIGDGIITIKQGGVSKGQLVSTKLHLLRSSSMQVVVAGLTSLVTTTI